MRRRRRVLAERGPIAERDVGERDQQAAMRDAARIGVLLGDAQADDEAARRILAIEQRADRFEERAGAEQRLETGRGIGLDLAWRDSGSRHYRIKQWRAADGRL